MQVPLELPKLYLQPKFNKSVNSSLDKISADPTSFSSKKNAEGRFKEQPDSRSRISSKPGWRVPLVVVQRHNALGVRMFRQCNMYFVAAEDRKRSGNRENSFFLESSLGPGSAAGGADP